MRDAGEGSLVRGILVGLAVGTAFLGAAYLIVGNAWSQGSFVAAFLLLVLGLAVAAVEIRRAGGPHAKKAVLLCGAIFWVASAVTIMVEGMRYWTLKGPFGGQETLVDCLLLPLLCFGIPALVVYALVPMVQPQRDRRSLWCIVILVLVGYGCAEVPARDYARKNSIAEVRRVAAKLGVALPSDVAWRVNLISGAPNNYLDVAGTAPGVSVIAHGLHGLLCGVEFREQSSAPRISSAQQAVSAVRACRLVRRNPALVPPVPIRPVRVGGGSAWTASIPVPSGLFAPDPHHSNSIPRDPHPPGTVTVTADGAVRLSFGDTEGAVYDD